MGGIGMIGLLVWCVGVRFEGASGGGVDLDGIGVIRKLVTHVAHSGFHNSVSQFAVIVAFQVFLVQVDIENFLASFGNRVARNISMLIPT